MPQIVTTAIVKSDWLGIGVTQAVREITLEQADGEHDATKAKMRGDFV